MAQSFFDKVYDILVRDGGASELMRFNFIYLHTCAISDGLCDEYRFSGLLGHGGKYLRRENKVTCYPEDENPVRLAMMRRINKALIQLKQSHDATSQNDSKKS